MVGLLQDGVRSGLRRALQGWRFRGRTCVIIAGIVQEWEVYCRSGVYIAGVVFLL